MDEQQSLAQGHREHAPLQPPFPARTHRPPHVLCPGTGALHQEADVTEHWLEATKKSLRCCQLLYCHLIPQFRDVLCSWNAPCWRAIGSSKGRIRAVNSPGTDTAVAVQPQAHSGMPARVRQVPRQPGALGLAREPSSHSSARAGIQPQARPPRCPGERKGREKRKKNQSLKGTSTAELW